MVEEYKHYNLVGYCVGWNFDGPIYAVHAVDHVDKGDIRNFPNVKIPLLKGFKSIFRRRKHKHNI